MPESKCCLCAKPGTFQKLFRKCKHEPACNDCLRALYVTKQQGGISSYPLKCFHPECNLVIRDTQMRRLVRSDKELQNFHILGERAKLPAKLQKLDAGMQSLEARKQTAMRVARLGKNWQQINRIFSPGEVCRCPDCRVLLTKNETKEHKEVKKANLADQPSWRVLAEALGVNEICSCPNCEMLIIKDGGCNEMTCFCGAVFLWKQTCQRIDECPDTVCRCGHHFSWTAGVEEMEIAVREVEESFWPIQAEYRRKYDLLLKTYESGYTPSRTIKPSVAPKVKRAPLLVRIDEDDVVFVEEEEDFVEDSCIDRNPWTLDQLLPKDVTFESPREDDYSYCEDHSSSVANHHDPYGGIMIASDVDSISFQSISLVEAPSTATFESQTSEWEQRDFHVFELDSDASSDSWPHFDVCLESESCIPPASTKRQASVDWEEVSEVSSVVSFHSKTGMSFLEAARAAAAPKQQGNKNNGWKEVSKVPIPMSQPVQIVVDANNKLTTKSEDPVDAMFDPFFIFDGVKCGRGGKQKFKNRVFV